MNKQETASAQWDAMSDQQKSEWLATKVMGWKPDKKSSTGRVIYWQVGDKDFIHFQPLTDWNHTMEVVKAMREKGLRHAFAEQAARIELQWWAGDVNASHFYDGVATGLVDLSKGTICKAAFFSLQ